MRLKQVLSMLCVSNALAIPGSALADQDHPHKDGAHAHSAAGTPGNPAKVSKVFDVRMLDTMRFEPSSFEVRSGQTVKFVVTNTGQVRHEFGIGTHDDQRAHAEMMLADPDMKHEDGSVITVEPGQTKELVWRFGRAGQYEAACQVPGHYPAGMMAKIVVKRR
jgi:uncharacterized cupredoxin-like copper-binding protein